MTDGAQDSTFVAQAGAVTHAGSEVRPEALAPGGPQAKARGCACSVLANAAYRAGQESEPCVDPSCPVHGPR